MKRPLDQTTLLKLIAFMSHRRTIVHSRKDCDTILAQIHRLASASLSKAEEAS